MMNGLPYYKAYPRDFIEGTVGMPFELKGAYRIVLDLIYMHGGDLPDDANYIAGILGCTVRQWGFHRKRLLEIGKLSVRGAFIASSRADQELFATRSYRDQQSFNGRQPKKTKELAEADASPKQKPKLNHTEPDTDTEKKKDREARKRAPEIELPPDWTPSDRNLSDAAARGFSQQEAADEADRFRDHHLARGTRFRDWDAAWRKWLGNARRYGGRVVAIGAIPGRGGQGGSLASIAARRRAAGAV
jgi:uncharacterized protein YdaU (DUF1376 family)